MDKNTNILELHSEGRLSGKEGPNVPHFFAEEGICAKQKNT